MTVNPLSKPNGSSGAPQPLSGNGSSGNGSGIYGSGSGGGGGSKDPTEEQKKAFNNLGAISGFNLETPKNTYNLGNEVLDVADKGNENIANFAINNAKRKATNEWYKQRQDLQSVVNQLTDSAGNMLYGSGIRDFMDLYARKDDQNNIETLNTERDNINSINQDRYEALQANINARNNTAVDAEESLRSVAADYAAQGNNIHPDLVKDYLDTDNHTLKLPDWMKTDFARDNFQQAVNPEMLDFIRPSMDAQTATNKKLVDRVPTTANASSTNQSYWQRLRNGYNRRNQ